MTKEISKIPDYAKECIQWEVSGAKDFQFLASFMEMQSQAEKLHGAALALAIWMAYKHWDNCPSEMGSKFDYNCDKFVLFYSGKIDVNSYRRIGKLLDGMRTGEVEIPKQVELLDAKRDPILDEETDSPVQIEVTMDFVTTHKNAFTKLVIGHHKATSEEGFSKEDWGLLFNPDVTVEQFRQHLLSGEGYGWPDNPGRFKAWQDGYCVMVSEAGKTEALIDTYGLNLEALEDGNPLVLKAYGMVCQSLRMKNEYEGDF